MQKLSEWQSIPKRYLRPWLVLFAGLVLTTYTSYVIKTSVEHQVQRDFAFECDEARLRIETRLQSHRQVLLGGAALIDAMQSVGRNEWHDYARRLQIDQHVNGIQGLGFSVLIPKEKLSSHIAEIRQQGFPDYRVHPTGEREVYSSVLYLEPFKGLNLRDFGYDMYSDSVLRAAMEQARDENVAALSGKVVLAQEVNQNGQAGTMMFVPVYRRQALIATELQRRNALIGWVYSPFRMNDLLQGVLQGNNIPGIKQIHLEVYDGPSANAASLLYNSAGEKQEAHSALQPFQLEQRTDFNGRVWTLRFAMLDGSSTGIDYSQAWSAFAAGLVSSFLLFFLTISYLNTRRNARRIADDLTAEIRRRIETERDLNDWMRLQSKALDASANAIVITNKDGIIQWANQAFCRLTGYAADEAIGHNPKELIRSGRQDQPFYERLWQTILAGKPWHGELINRRKDGTFYDEELTITPVSDEQGESTHFIVVKQDITQRKRAEEALRESESRFRTMADQAPVLIWIAGVDKLCTWFNKVWLDFTGRTLLQEMGKGWADSMHPDDLQRCWDTYTMAFDARQEFSLEFRLRRFDGEYRWLTLHGVPRCDDQGEFLGYIGSCIDINDRHQMEVKVQQLAYYDHLTKLPNRRLLSERLSQAMMASKRNGLYGALMFLDLDNFKPLNDTHGHAVGDLLLIEVAKRLKSSVREIDTVARMGGDEFVVMLSELEADKTRSIWHAGNVAEKIRIALSEPFLLTAPHDEEAQAPTIMHRCTASIGVAMFSGQDTSQDNIIQWADEAMYQAKEGGRNQIRFYEAAA